MKKTLLCRNFYFICKRTLDVLCGLIGIVILFPLIITIKAAYLTQGDTFSIFYSQKRVGLHGKEFNILKFRSMIPEAEKILEQMLEKEDYRKEWLINRKFKNDPRITNIGKILRKTSLDELPQLLNVLAGDMSLVGPRPLAIGELEEHNGLKLYQEVKPGITGWWACNGRNNIDYPQRLELEYYYVKNCSFYLDVLCIFKTIIAVLKKEGVH